MNERTPVNPPARRPRASRASKLRAGAFPCALLVASLLVAAALSPAPSRSATPPAPGNVTLKIGGYYGLPTTGTYTASYEVFASTDCSGAGGGATTVQHIDEATGHTFALGAAQSALLTASPGGTSGQSEQNGIFVNWQNGAASPVATYLPGDGRQVCVQGVDAPGGYEYVARFAPGIQYFDSCGTERYEFRPGEAVTIKVTGGLKHAGAEPYRLQAAGGSANECTWIPEAPAFTTVHVTTDPFTYTFTLPASDAEIPASCLSSNSTTIIGSWRSVAYDVPGCGCNRADVRFQVVSGPAPSGCPLDCPDDITVTSAADSCGATVNYDTPAAAPGSTVTCDHPSGSVFPAGTTTVTCTSSAGPSCSFDVTVNDAHDPFIDAPADVTASADASCGASGVPLGTPAFSDNCASGVTVSNDAPAVFPTGATVVTWTATDAAGNTATDTQTVTVEDDTAPGVSAPADITAAADSGSCSASLSPGAAAATDNCAGVGVSGVRGDGKPLAAPYPVGTTTITWTATDAAGNTAADTQTVTVTDAQAPTISGASATPPARWPPNHKLSEVVINYSAADNCGAVNCVISGVTSNEPVDGTGDGATTPDWVIIDPHHVLLRAERSGDGTGRVYTVTITCSDGGGNASSRSVNVYVPHNQ